MHTGSHPKFIKVLSTFSAPPVVEVDKPAVVALPAATVDAPRLSLRCQERVSSRRLLCRQPQVPMISEATAPTQGRSADSKVPAELPAAGSDAPVTALPAVAGVAIIPASPSGNNRQLGHHRVASGDTRNNGSCYCASSSSRDFAGVAD